MVSHRNYNAVLQNSKAMVRSSVSDTDFIDIVAGVLQRDKTALYMFIICQYYVFRTSLDKKKR